MEKLFPAPPKGLEKPVLPLFWKRQWQSKRAPRAPRTKKGMPWGSGTGQEGPQTVECLGAGRPQLPKPLGQPSGSLGKGPEKVPAEAAGRAPEGHGF